MAGKGAEAWFTPWRFAAILALLILACFPRVIVGFETFFYRDFGGFGYPLAFYHKEAFWRGEIPLWNPESYCGLPFTAQWNTLTLYPLSLFYLLFPLPWSLGIFCLGHLFLAGMGMYFLAYRWTNHRLAAAIAGVIFAFNGLTWYSLMWPNNISALAWMPWVVLAVERAWREGGRRIVVAALVGAMQMLAGAPEVIMQTWFVLGVMWLVQFYLGEIARPKLVGRAAVVCFLVAALAAAQLLPFLDLLKHSQRSIDFGDSQWAMPASGWANYLVPIFHCHTGVYGAFTQINQYWTSSYYMGIGTVMFTLLAIWRVRGQRVWLLASLACFSMIMALGEHGLVYSGLKHVLPQLGFMRFPIKFIVMATFLIPLLAAMGFNWLMTLPDEQWRQGWKKTKVVGWVLLGLISLIIWFACKHPLPSDNVNATIKNAFSRGLFLVLILGCVAVLHTRSGTKIQWWLQIGLIVLFWMDVFTHAPNLSPTVERWVWNPDSTREYFKWGDQLRPGVSRAMSSVEALNKIHFASVGQAEPDVNGRRLGLFANYNLLDHASKFDGFFSLYIHEMDDVVVTKYLGTNAATGLKNFLGVAFVSHPVNPVDWVGRDSFLPMVTGGQKPVFVEDTTALDVIFDERFNPQRAVYLSPEAAKVVKATNWTDVKITSREFSAQRVGVEVETAAPAMVVIAQAYYHPWQAYVDGKPTRLWRANHAFQALEVPAGKHRVEVVYKDKMFLAGTLISLVTLLSCGVAWLRSRKALKST
ncbi:MAG: hypothetical protein JWQ71_3141 [Pedosphaera sp.]|nr:hypothetical protein [Pedosphaera sp.]